MSLDEIGFYTLSEARAQQATASTPLNRCEMLLTGRCNFRCPYCRHVGGRDIDQRQAHETLRWWIQEGMQNIRFSGGEPALHPNLAELVTVAQAHGVKRIAVSTNGSAPLDYYVQLICAGVSDYSISLDACCAEDGDKMAGGRKGAWRRVVENIKALAVRVYTTVGVVLTPDNAAKVGETIQFAHLLGVADIRVIPAAQEGETLPPVEVKESVLRKHPILRYRLANLQAGRSVRGLQASDSPRCGLVLDDMAVMGEYHYPCIIHLREGGAPIGRIGPYMRADRDRWWRAHDTHADPICHRNCLDVCVDYNNVHAKHAGQL